MSGIYIHVPFCRQACRYCDFYFTVSLKYRDDYVAALLREIELRKTQIGSSTVDTIYFGGGTPSVLSPEHLESIFERLRSDFTISNDAEITLEANPDDLSPGYLKDLKMLGFNRLSIGVQSFHQDDLSLMRRSHTETQAAKCILNAAEAGFNNINMDLIYGVPGLSMKKWERNLHYAMELPVQHLSAYHLTYEAGTIFDHWKKKGKLFEVEETISIEQYKLLKEISSGSGFEHYEISNFALDGYRSRHNTAYWENKAYLGLGPAAHSFDGAHRSWNVSSVKSYINKLEKGGVFNKKETLTEKDRFNENLIVSMRAIWGLDMEYIRSAFDDSAHEALLQAAKSHIESGVLQLQNDKLTIDPDQWLKADMVLRDLIIE
jgi:oxygen-independent coproporphyrinogen III oxidase